MKNRLAAVRYAGALAAAISEDSRLEGILAEVCVVRDLLADHQEIHIALANPAFTTAMRTALLQELLAGTGASAEVARFIDLVYHKGRLSLVGDICEAMAEAVDDRLNRATALVITAIELTPEHEARLQASLARFTGKNISLVKTVDPSILGGVRARIGDRVIDGTLRARLDRLHDHLIAEEIA
jgi:F-type H+-transporting ATPase subunit delta